MSDAITLSSVRPEAFTSLATPSKAVLIRSVSKQFETVAGPIVAVDNIDLDVADGEFVVIVGPSGCGKTTLLRMLAQLETPTSGSISYSRHSGAPATNSMVFQGRSVFPWLTVAENVGYGLKLDGVPRAKRQELIVDPLNTVGLSRFKDAYPHQLSEGMRQRVAIARSLAVDPDLLLMDEPFGALDEQTRFILQEELLRIWEETRKTIVLVTHSIDEALTLADRIVVLSAHPGRISAIIPVPFSRPRLQSSVRSDPAFAGLFSQIWDLIRAEVQRARGDAGEQVK
jgi:NitT/TauT family transport system ATP-binding protein